MFKFILIYYLYFNLNYLIVKTESESKRSEDEWFLEESVSCIFISATTQVCIAMATSAAGIRIRN